MTDDPIPRRQALALAAAVPLVLVGCSGGAGGRRPEMAFPDQVPTATTPRQRRVVEVLRAEHAAQHPASRYTPVAGEPWCADFVSWVERASGRPLRNPHGGGWRIPGTMTLLDTLRDAGQWHPRREGYVPVAGDIAIYDRPSTFGQHTNFVLALEDGWLTTVGGNEYPNRIRVTRHRMDDRLGCLGFGHRA